MECEQPVTKQHGTGPRSELNKITTIVSPGKFDNFLSQLPSQGPRCRMNNLAELLWDFKNRIPESIL